MIQRGRAFSVRTRLILTVLVLVASGLALTGLTSYQLARSDLVQESAARLARESADLDTLVTGVDPQTGQPFTGLPDLLEAAIQQRVLAGPDGVLGVVASQVVWTAPDGVGVRPEDDPELLSALLPKADSETTSSGRLATPEHDWLYFVTPLRVAGDPQTGALIRVTDLELQFAQLNSTYVTFGLVALGTTLLITAVTGLLAGRLLEPLTWVRRTAESITEEDMSRRIAVRGHDDLAALTRTINGMLDRLQTLVETQRNLLDDVGHELKTPLTILHGHLELLDPDDADEVARTRELALDEVERMSNLTEELLVLAQAQRVDFVRPRPVDVGQLTDEVLELARGLAMRPWRLEGLAEVRVSLDPERLIQAWLQLADNAVKYSPDGSPVGIGSAVVDGELRCWVSDRGIGIADAEVERVLQRFGRSRDPEAKARGGAGLGLAIVDSIARAHGGRVDIRSSVGEGSTIGIVIPYEPTPREDDDPDSDR